MQLGHHRTIIFKVLEHHGRSTYRNSTISMHSSIKKTSHQQNISMYRLMDTPHSTTHAVQKERKNYSILFSYFLAGWSILAAPPKVYRLQTCSQSNNMRKARSLIQRPSKLTNNGIKVMWSKKWSQLEIRCLLVKIFISPLEHKKKLCCVHTQNCPRWGAKPLSRK